MPTPSGRGPSTEDLVAIWLAVLRNSFPEGLPDGDYYALLAALDDMSQKNAALLVARFLNMNEYKVYNDVCGVLTNDPAVDHADVERVRRRLAEKGWYELE